MCAAALLCVLFRRRICSVQHHLIELPSACALFSTFHLNSAAAAAVKKTLSSSAV